MNTEDIARAYMRGLRSALSIGLGTAGLISVILYAERLGAFLMFILVIVLSGIVLSSGLIDIMHTMKKIHPTKPTQYTLQSAKANCKNPLGSNPKAMKALP